ncbi:MAG: TPM domain-containing protein [Chloroflexota bacterium]
MSKSTDRWLKLLIFIALILGFNLVPSQAQTIYPKPQNSYINDYASVISQTEATNILTTLSKLREEAGIEMSVVTITALSGYAAKGETLESFATGLFNAWGIGDPDQNNGVLMLVVISDQRTRIELGTGYGNQHNAALQTIIGETMSPSFLEGRYGEGILQGTEAIATHLRNNTPTQPTSESFDAIKLGIVIAFILSLTGVAILLALANKNRRYKGKIGWYNSSSWGQDDYTSGSSSTGSFGGGSSSGDGASGDW